MSRTYAASLTHIYYAHTCLALRRRLRWPKTAGTLRCDLTHSSATSRCAAAGNHSVPQCHVDECRPAHSQKPEKIALAYTEGTVLLSSCFCSRDCHQAHVKRRNVTNIKQILPG